MSNWALTRASIRQLSQAMMLPVEASRRSTLKSQRPCFSASSTTCCAAQLLYPNLSRSSATASSRV